MPHVRDLGMSSADDESLWAKAASEGFVIVSKDADFHQRSFVRGHPPKVVWIQLGNCTTTDVVRLLTARAREIARFVAAETESFLALRE
jgi:predicted nuclease of predicted toxin-antitoxin system